MGSSYLIQMTYLDPTNNDRGSDGIPMAYSLVVPKDEMPKIVSIIKENPDMLLQLFKKVFPGMDNSYLNGKQLKIDMANVTFQGVETGR